MGTTLTLVRTTTSGRAVVRSAFGAGFWGMPVHSIVGAGICPHDGSIPSYGIAVPDASLAAPSGSMSP